MLPLQGVKVVEIAENLAGPYAGQILALMGAEVLKVERPEGDNARGWGPPFHGGMATTFQAMNMNKRSVTLDFRNEDDFAWLVERIGQSDVVLQNLRPGALEKLGLGRRRWSRPIRGWFTARCGRWGRWGRGGCRRGSSRWCRRFPGCSR